MPPLLRAARGSDLNGLLALSQTAGAGMTSLPPDLTHLAERIRRSADAFAHSPTRPGAEQYVFVIEDDDEQIVGTSAVIARVGGYDAFYTYELRSEPVRHLPLGVDRSIDVLHLKQDHKGPSELCGLVVAGNRRGAGLGRLASVGRLLFMATRPPSFAERTIAEIRGFQTDDGAYPFWDAIGQVFFSPRDFAEADTLTGLGQKDFIADLMPRHPIYADLLPPEVRAAIGRPHRDAVPAMATLEGEGFARSTEVDIFDAGPILECATADIHAIAKARRVRLAWVSDDPVPGVAVVVAATSGGFRAVACRTTLGTDAIVIDRASAERLGVAAGDELIATPARGSRV